MIRIEAYSVLAGIHVRVIGVCSTPHGSGERCPGATVSTLITPDQLENHGPHYAITRTVADAFWLDESLVEYLQH